MTATLPPDPDQLKAADAGNYSAASSVKMIVESLTAKRYLIACSKCGLVLGGYAGKTAPEVVAETKEV